MCFFETRGCSWFDTHLKTRNRLNSQTTTCDGGRGKKMGQGVMLGAFLHAEQKLHADSDTGVPAQRDDTDVTCHNRRTQEVLDRRGAIRITVKHL